uniref:Hes family bHLH transcription factor 2 n=1 Tax=Chinchilla lanigera TaxID=34839 RepID=A0A8C2V0I7_CHILA
MGLPRREGDAAELRKSLKPLLEKRRRARINDSLSQLKGLILPLLGRENSRYSKLEKADILEMTVHFLQELPASSCPAAAPGERLYTRPIPALRPRALTPCRPSHRCPPAGPTDSYSEGYRACVARLARVLPACGVLEPAVSARLLEHLRRRSLCTTPDARPPSPPSPPSPPAPTPSPPAPPSPGLWRPW